jgi:hypothetical protein
MPINFPNSPSANQTYTFGGRTWRWNGVGWQVFNATLLPEIGTNTVAQTFTLAAGATTLLSYELSPVVQIYNVSVTATNSSATAWIRVYLNSAGASADANRSIADDPANTSGVVTEIITVISPQSFNITPIASAVNAQSPRSSAYPVRITNTSTVAATFTVTFNFVLLTIN